MMPDGSPIPLDMFTWTQEELTLNPEMEAVLTPPHIVARKAAAASSVPSGEEVTTAGAVEKMEIKMDISNSEGMNGTA
jgi:hypothetical protein